MPYASSKRGHSITDEAKQTGEKRKWRERGGKRDVSGLVEALKWAWDGIFFRNPGHMQQEKLG